MVEPTNLNPRRSRSRLMASDSSSRGHFRQCLPSVLDWLAADEAPQVNVEAAELFSHGEKHLRILDGGRDLQTVAHDPGVAEQALHIARAVARDLFRAK